MTEPFYIPVGTKLTRSVLKNITPEQMRSREIFDPRFVGFEADFEWRDYITVTMPNSVLRNRVIGSLDQFAQTPEGQHVIRQAGAMQNYREYGQIDPHGKPQARVTITDGAVNQHLSGVISSNLAQIYRNEYRGADGQYYDWSVQGTVLHELSHAMDAVSTKYNKDQLYKHFAMPLLKAEQAHDALVQKKILNMDHVDTLMGFRERYAAPLTEYPAIRTANAIMQRYYNEPPRALSHAELTTARQEKAEEMFITHDALGADHFYDELLVAPATPPVPTTRHRSR